MPGINCPKTHSILQEIIFKKSFVVYLQMLVSNLSGVTDRTAFNANRTLANDDDDKRTTLDSIEHLVFKNTHDSIVAILKVSPLAGRTALLQVFLFAIHAELRKIDIFKYDDLMF